MDPALYYTVAAYQLTNYVWTGLVGYKHENGPGGATLVPYLAESMPKISADGKNYKFTLREGLKYSNGKPVKASDFRYTIERDFKMDSPGVGFYSDITGVSGVNGFATTKKGHISGIVTNDANRTIEIKLDQPRGDFLYILAMEFSHFVPAGTPASDQSTHPIPATGPYMLQSYSPNRSIVLVRNPNYNDQIPTMPTGNPDKVEATIITDPVAAYQRVVSGQGGLRLPAGPGRPSAGGAVEVQGPAADLYEREHVLLRNQQSHPAVQQHPGAQGGADGDRSGGDHLGHLRRAREAHGELPAAGLSAVQEDHRRLVVRPREGEAARAAVRHGRRGRWTSTGRTRTRPRRPPSTWPTSCGRSATSTKLHLLEHSVYFQTIGAQKTGAEAMFTDWYQDYPHPLDWFDVLLNGNRITETHNNNPGNVDVPAVNKEIEALKKISDITPEVNNRWAKVDTRPDGHECDDDPVHEPVANRLLRCRHGHELLRVRSRDLLGLRSQLQEVGMSAGGRVPSVGALPPVQFPAC